MKLLDKIKNAIFEDDELEEVEQKTEEVQKTEVVPVIKEEEVVKKIDIEKTIPKRIEVPINDYVERESVTPPKRERRRTPVIFDEDDFIMEDEPIPVPKRETPVPEIPKKVLYGGYKDEKPKEKFKPSPVISPVYGFVSVSPVLEQPRNEELSSFNEMFAKEKKDVVTVDQVREKAYGVSSVTSDEDDDLGLLYDMKQEETPAISKITLGDAEEYFDDLGLEYNVDYKDSSKPKSSSTRSKKNNDLEETILNADFDEKLETTKELEITKEQLKPKTAKEIKKIKKITDLDIPDDDDDEPDEVDEKNLYDLIDMMYDSKE